jgi:prepilin-type processing-associated H-X9-DG protein
MRINNSNEWGHLFYSFHDGGAVFALADGSVRPIAFDTPADTVKALLSPGGGEVVATD